MIFDQDQKGSPERGLNLEPAARVAEATELVTPQQAAGPDFMQSIYDTWGYASNNKLEVAGMAITTMAATAAVAYFKPWKLLPAVGGGLENAGTRLFGANATEALISTGLPITPESRAAARAAAALGLSPIEQAAAINGTRFGSSSTAESLLLNGIPITPENRRLAARGLLRSLTDR